MLYFLVLEDLVRDCYVHLESLFDSFLYIPFVTSSFSECPYGFGVARYTYICPNYLLEYV